MDTSPTIATTDLHHAPLGEPLMLEVPLPQADRAILPEPELTILMPCLNEHETVAGCVKAAMEALKANDIAGEVIVADNGSTDGSPQIAAELGARVVAVSQKGYGNALMGGIAAARGRYILMGDADQSYDFHEAPKFLAKLREGNELVQGCRLPRGGGTVVPGAMPFLHRWWGNPMFSWLARRWFNTGISDIYCGLRGFSKEMYTRLDQRCTGMEFATEMIIKASLSGERISEVPITLHPDGRKTAAPHLKTFRDGWRTLRFFLICTPRYLFLVPGMLLILLGLIGYGMALPAMKIGNVTFDVHTLLVASLSILIGYQAIWFAVLAKTFAINERLLPEDPDFMKLFEWFDLEKGLLLGVGAFVIGFALLGTAVNQWRLHEFGRLDYARTMRWVIPGTLLCALGAQTVFSSFLVSILGMRRK